MIANSCNRTLKSAVRRSVAWGYYLSNLYRLRHRAKVVILAYHRVLPETELRRRRVQPGMYVLDHVFEQHMQFLQEHFLILSFDELLERWKKKIWERQQRYCVITFDDGWLDNYLYAYPVLTKYRLPATVFLATDFIGTHEWFWPEKMSYLLEQFLDPTLASRKKAECYFLLEQFLDRRKGTAYAFTAYPSGEGHILDEIIEQCKKLPSEAIHKLIEEIAAILEIQVPTERLLLDWSEVAQMSKDRISFGSHSCTHRILTNLSRSEIEMELKASKRELVARQVNDVPVFCYPNGNCNEEIKNLVRDSGYQAAVGVHSGVEGELPKNMFELRRIGIHNDITNTISLFSFHLLGPF